MSKDYSPYQSPQSYEPLKPQPGARPPQWWLFQLYCGLMAALYLLVTVMGGFFLFLSMEVKGEDSVQAVVYGVVLLVTGPLFGVGYGIGPFLPARRWAWIYSVVLIGIGLNSCCTWPLSIPLLIIWIKKETQAYFPK